MPLPDFTVFNEKLKILKQLTKALPTTVFLANPSDRIPEVFKSIPEENDVSTHWETFNRRMDALFGHELRDPESGRLIHVRRGALGVDAVLGYLQRVTDAGNLNWDLAAIKVDRLIVEFKEIM